MLVKPWEYVSDFRQGSASDIPSGSHVGPGDRSDPTQEGTE